MLAFFFFSCFFNFQSLFKILNSDSILTRAKLAIIVLDCTVLFGFEAVGNRESCLDYCLLCLEDHVGYLRFEWGGLVFELEVIFYSIILRE